MPMVSRTPQQLAASPEMGRACFSQRGTMWFPQFWETTKHLQPNHKKLTVTIKVPQQQLNRPVQNAKSNRKTAAQMGVESRAGQSALHLGQGMASCPEAACKVQETKIEKIYIYEEHVIFVHICIT